MSALKPFHLEILSPERSFYRGDCLSLVVPISDGMLGIQAGLWNEADHVRGVQAGIVNVAGEARGLQVGLINRSETMYGYQVGLINVIRDAELQFFPVLNIGF